MKFADLRNDGVGGDANENYPRLYLPRDAFIAYNNSSIAVQNAIGRQELAVERAVESKAMEIARNRIV